MGQAYDAYNPGAGYYIDGFWWSEKHQALEKLVLVEKFSLSEAEDYLTLLEQSYYSGKDKYHVARW